MKVIDVRVAGCRVFGREGFVQLHRHQACNVFEDGSCSDSYTLDVVQRPCGADAVAVLPFFLPESRHASTTREHCRVLLRRGLRPAIRLGRPEGLTREGQLAEIHHLEVVAGILERQDHGDEGLRQRASTELVEEIGLHVDPRRIQLLGSPVCLSPGLMAERVYFCCVEVDPDAPGQPRGDGSLLEQGGEAVIFTLDQALEHCARGVIRDAKTELALRRLKERLAGV